MPGQPGDVATRQSSRRRRTVGWVLGLILALVAGGVGAVVMRRDRPPLASRPLLVRTPDHPLVMDRGSDPWDRFDPPRPGERAGIPAATVFRTLVRQTRHSVYERAIPSSKPIPVTLARWSRARGTGVASPERLVWLFQLTSVPCMDAGFQPPGRPTPPPDRDGCDDYLVSDARSGARVTGGLSTAAGAAVLRPA